MVEAEATTTLMAMMQATSGNAMMPKRTERMIAFISCPFTLSLRCLFTLVLSLLCLISCSLAGRDERKREKATYDEADDEERDLATHKGSDLAELSGSGSGAEEPIEQQKGGASLDKRKLMDQFPIVSDYSLSKKVRAFVCLL